MSTYRIISTTTVKFGKYDDVLRVMEKRAFGHLYSLLVIHNLSYLKKVHWQNRFKTEPTRAIF